MVGSLKILCVASLPAGSGFQEDQSFAANTWVSGTAKHAISNPANMKAAAADYSGRELAIKSAATSIERRREEQWNEGFYEEEDEQWHPPYTIRRSPA